MSDLEAGRLYQDADGKGNPGVFTGRFDDDGTPVYRKPTPEEVRQYAGAIEAPTMGQDLPFWGPTIGGVIGENIGSVGGWPGRKAGEFIGTAGGYALSGVPIGESIDQAARDTATSMVLGKTGQVLGRIPAVRKAADVVKDAGEEALRAVSKGARTAAGKTRGLTKWVSGIDKDAAPDIEGIFERALSGRGLTLSEAGDLGTEAIDRYGDSLPLTPGMRTPGGIRQDLEATALANTASRRKMRATVDRGLRSIDDLLDAKIPPHLSGETFAPRLRKAIQDGDAAMRDRDAVRYEEVFWNNLRWDAGSREKAADVIRDGIQADVARVQSVKASRSALGNDTRALITEADSLVSDLRAGKLGPDGMPLPDSTNAQELNEFRQRVGAALARAEADVGREADAAVLAKLYGTVLDAQKQLLPAGVRPEWDKIRADTRAYKTARAKLFPYLEGGQGDAQTLLKRISGDPSALEAATLLAKAGGDEDIAQQFTAAWLRQAVEESKSVDAFVKRVGKTHPDVRKAIAADPLAEQALMMVALRQRVNLPIYDAAQPGAGQGRMVLDVLGGTPAETAGRVAQAGLWRQVLLPYYARIIEELPALSAAAADPDDMVAQLAYKAASQIVEKAARTKISQDYYPGSFPLGPDRPETPAPGLEGVLNPPQPRPAARGIEGVLERYGR